MGQSTVQHTQTQATTSVSSLSKAFASNNTVNNLLWYAALWDPASPNPTVTDTRNTPSGALVGPLNAAGATMSSYNVGNCGAGANMVQLSWGAPNPTFAGLYIHEFTDTATHTSGFTFDQKAQANNTSTNPNSGATPAVAQSIEIVCGFSNSNGPVPTAGGAAAILEQDSTLNGIGTEVEFITTGGTPSSAFTEVSSIWACQCVTFFTAATGSNNVLMWVKG